MRFPRLFAVAMAVCSLLPGVPVSAQQASAQQEIDAGRAMVRAEFKKVIREELPLTEQQAASFWPVYDEYEKDVAAITDRYAALVTNYVERFRAGDLTDEYADELLTGYFAIRQELLDVRRAYIPRFKAVLPALKVTQLYQLENKLNAEVDIQLALAIPLISE